MDLEKILAELRLERENLEEAIDCLERLASNGAKRRGRPPSWLTKAKASVDTEPVASAPAKRGRKPKSRAARTESTESAN